MKRNSHRNSGVVLIVVLIVCLGLVSLTLILNHTMLLAYRGSDNELAGRQAEMAVEGGAQYAEAVMRNLQSPGQLPLQTNYQFQDVPLGEGNFWFIGEPDPTDTSNQVVFGLADEAGKLNLNTATEAMLENLPNMTQDLADEIIAWRTDPSTTSGSSASTSSATTGNAPVKEAPFESVEELAQVNNGTDLSLLYGNDSNLNHVLDPEESGSGASTIAPGLLEYVTVFTRQPNVMESGSTRINVTQQNNTQLTTILTSLISATRSQQISQALQSGNAPKSVLEFYVKSGMTSDEFALVSPYLTGTTGKYSVGLVNVNSASQAVLQCVPGITQSTAQQIVSARASETLTTGTSTPNLAWVGSILGATASAQAGPYLTAETYQVSADVAAVGRHGRGYRRTQFVIDNSSYTPQIVYRRDLSGLGWALGSTERDAVAQEDVPK